MVVGPVVAAMVCSTVLVHVDVGCSRPNQMIVGINLCIRELASNANTNSSTMILHVSAIILYYCRLIVLMIATVQNSDTSLVTC